MASVSLRRCVGPDAFSPSTTPTSHQESKDRHQGSEEHGCGAAAEAAAAAATTCTAPLRTRTAGSDAVARRIGLCRAVIGIHGCITLPEQPMRAIRAAMAPHKPGRVTLGRSPQRILSLPRTVCQVRPCTVLHAVCICHDHPMCATRPSAATCALVCVSLQIPRLAACPNVTNNSTRRRPAAVTQKALSSSTPQTLVHRNNKTARLTVCVAAAAVLRPSPQLSIAGWEA
jgi:hypothetical protein